jgi:hypothetical protein
MRATLDWSWELLSDVERQALEEVSVFAAPFGIDAAEEGVMNELTKNLPGVISYLDDVVIGGTTKTEHDENLRKFLQMASEKGLSLNRKKCQFSKTNITFLGHLIGEGRI